MLPHIGLFALWLVAAPEAQAGGRDVSKVESMMAEQRYDEALAHIQEALRKKQDYDSLQELKRLQNQAWFGLAEQEHSVASYRRYLARYNQGPGANLASLRVCELAFEAASTEALGGAGAAPMIAYMEEHGGCMELHDARVMAVDLTIADARADGSSRALREALARFPVECSEAGLRREEDDASYREVLADGGLDAYLGYLDSHPRGQHREELTDLAEGLAWEAVLVQEGEAPVVAFLQRFPDGPHAAEARGLRKQRTRGIRRMVGERWEPLEVAWPGASTLVFQAEPGTVEAPPVLRIGARHSTPSGVVGTSRLVFPAAPWIEARLGLDDGALDSPSLWGEGPGEAGEWSFHVPFALQAWSYAGAELQGYTLEVIEPRSGEVLATVEIEPAGSEPVALPSLVHADGAELQRLAASLGSAGDPFALLLRGAIAASSGELGEASKAWAGARERWPALPEGAPGLEPAAHSGTLLVAYGDPARPPGSPDNAFLPVAYANSGRIGGARGAEPGSKGEVLLSSGRRIGTYSSSGQPGRMCGRSGTQGRLSVASGVSPQALFGQHLYLLHPPSRVHRSGWELEDGFERWPALAEVMGSTPEDWLRSELQASGTEPLGDSEGIRLSDLDGDGLPDLLRGRDGNLVLVRLDAAGEMEVRPLGSAGLPELLLDLDGDGSVEILTRSSGPNGEFFRLLRVVGSGLGIVASASSACGVRQ